LNASANSSTAGQFRRQFQRAGGEARGTGGIVVCGRTQGSFNLDISYVKPYAMDRGTETMTILNVSEARSNLYRLIDQANESHEPVIISGKRKNAVLLAEEDWNAIQETLYLVSIPSMRESILNGMQEPLSESSSELDW
jgi:antitoxin YefM